MMRKGDRIMRPTMFRKSGSALFAATLFVSMALHVALGLKKKVVLFNNVFNSKEFELYGLGEIVEPEGYDCTDYQQALQAVSSNANQFPLGLIYQKQEPTLDDGIEKIAAQATAGGPVEMKDVVGEFL